MERDPKVCCKTAKLATTMHHRSGILDLESEAATGSAALGAPMSSIGIFFRKRDSAIPISLLKYPVAS